jgi:hypothetical protein
MEWLFSSVNIGFRSEIGETNLKNITVSDWICLPTGWVKLTIDGSFLAANNTAGLGIVLQNVEGTPIFTSCRFVEDCTSPLEAELRACAEELELALRNSQLPIIVETDCGQLVDAAKSSVQDRSPLLHLVYETGFG